MKAYYIEKPENITIKEQAIPVPGAGEVVVRIQAIGICGSDAHLYKGTYAGPQNYPIMFGHEWSGYVETVVDDVTGFAPGDLVTGDCSRYCGSCEFCSRDKNLCSTIEKYGITLDGASAEYIVRNARYLYKAPQGIHPDLLALTEPLAVSAHHIEYLLGLDKLSPESRVLVVGAGGIGLGVYLQLRYSHGFRQVDVTDISPLRQKIARELGAAVPEGNVFTGEAGNGSSYADLYSESSYDCIIDTTGNAGIFSRCLDLVRPLGIVGSIGMSTGSVIDQKKIVLKGLTLIGSIGGTGNFPEVIDFIHRYEEKVARLVSHTFPMSKVAEALKLSTDSRESVKVMLKLGN